MSELNPLSGETLDLTKENIEKLKELFPEVLTENQIDFEKLRLILGDEVNDKPEKYSFTWNGKQGAIKLAQQSSTGTLRPNKEKSKDWDTTENLYIEGDNLEVLKLLQKSYSEKIKMVYIDPPYNTGNDFVYKDNYKDNIQNYFEQTDQVDSEGNKLSTNTDYSGRFHTDWLNMMYPRLMLAKNLLTDDGVIFMSIDDNEQANLKKMCDEIFGHNNVETLIWNKEAEGSSGSLKQIKTTKRIHEYVICAFKNYDSIQFEKVREALKGREDEFQTANLAVNSKTENPGHDNYFEIVNPSGKSFTRQWKWDKEEINRLIEEDLIYWGSDGNRQPRLIIPLDDRRRTYLQSILNYGGTTVGRKEFEALLGDEAEFSYPKPIMLLKKIIETSSDKDSIILDFFAGSSTTAHATMYQNSLDNGNRKFIMVQLPEAVTKDNISYKNGYTTLSEISQERINRAGDKVLNESKLSRNELDIGFKVFELDNSNIQRWNVDSENIEESLFSMENNFVEGRSHADIVYEVILKLGLDLNTPFEESKINESTVYDIALGNVYVVLGENITQEVANYLADKQKEYENENPSVVFNDNGFVSDNEKLNSIEILKNNGFNEEQLMSI